MHWTSVTLIAPILELCGCRRMWGKWTVHLFDVNYLFWEVGEPKVRQSQGYTGEDFWLDSIVIQLHTHAEFSSVVVFFFPSPSGFWWKLYIKDQTTFFPFVLWLNMLHSVCAFSITFSPTLRSPSSAAISNSDPSLSLLFAHCSQGEFKVTQAPHQLWGRWHLRLKSIT